MKKYYHNFEFGHETDEYDAVSQSLKDLVEKSYTFLPSKSVDLLEAGCGAAQLANSLIDLCDTVTGCDISAAAINRAKALFPVIKLMNHDLCQAPLDQKFDIIVDGHLLHCLITNEDRSNYLNNIKAMLKDRGIFVIESLVQSKSMNFTLPYIYSSPVLYMIAKPHYYGTVELQEHTVIPARFIQSFIEIEREILEAGFRIEFLKLPLGLKGIVDKNTPGSSAPDIIQIIARKA